MAGANTNFNEWDQIFLLREQIKTTYKENTDTGRERSYTDEFGDVRCTKCGSKRDISKCGDCLNEKAF